MTARSRKVAAKRGNAGKKPVRKRAVPQGESNVPEVEVLADQMDLMTPEVIKQLAQVERIIGQFEGMSDAKLAANIKDWAGLAAELSKQAVRAGASALVYAWACGKLLKETKEKLGHGPFGKWRREHVESAGISVRTSTRYMKLAESCSDVRGLLQWAPTLRQAYVGCGVLPPPPERDKDEPDGDLSDEEKEQKKNEREVAEVQRKKHVLLESVSALQQRLHQGIAIKGKLDAGEIRQLRLAQTQIYAFFDQILGKKS